MEQFLIGWDGVMAFDEDDSPEDVLGRVMEHLLESDLIDPTLDFERSTGRIDFEAIAEGVDPLAAIARAAIAYRTALQKAGVDTGHWVNPAEEFVRQSKEAAVRLDESPSVKHLVDA